ncbi:MAG: DNA primase small subunit domain-containing protein [Candidatus Woesearchaeota archaeon]
MQEILRFYSRKDVQKEILRFAKEREIGVRFREAFGKRPDILQYPSDVQELAKQGATSFHISVERWKNPLDLKSGLSRKQLDDLRKGFDLVIDIDSKFIEYSKVAGNLIVEALKFNGIKNISVKFSGGTGIHILVPFESFPKEVNGQETRLLFPEIPKAMAEYIKYLIKPYLKKEILSFSTLEEISKSTKIAIGDLKEKNEFNPFKIIDIDSQLISSRHMIRSVYSVNEKTNLVSVPIDINKIKEFNLKQAKMSNVEVSEDFFQLEKSELEEAKTLFIQAMDFVQKEAKVEVKIKRDYEIPKIAIKESYFPDCINKLLGGLKQDGRKRGVFILVGFLQHMGWDYESIEKALLRWNKKNYEPLREGYILGQIRWFKAQPKKILPPNCDHESYYKTMGIKCLNCKCKNPVNYVKIKLENTKRGKKK